MKRNILLTIEYDGTDFAGWQRQPEVRTVQGTLEEALTRVCRMPVQINGTSRTDAGVHALGQRASFSGDFGIPTDRLMLALNNMLDGGMNRRGKGSDVRVIGVEEMPEEFHARFDSKGKKYRYILDLSPQVDIFKRNYCYHIKTPLDLDAMRQGAEQIVGTHDFACFQAAGGNVRETTVRTIYSLELIEVETANSEELHIEVSGDGFLYNMVRIIVGTLVDIGQGKIDAEQVKHIIDSCDRQNAGHTAPAQGLYLVEIYY